MSTGLGALLVTGAILAVVGLLVTAWRMLPRRGGSPAAEDLLDALAVPALLVDRTRVLRANPALARLLGWSSPSDLHGVGLGRLFDSEAVVDTWQNAHPWRTTTSLRHHQGRAVPAVLEIARLPDPQRALWTVFPQAEGTPDVGGLAPVALRVVHDVNNMLACATLGLSAFGSRLERRLVDGDTEHDLIDLLHDAHAVTIETTEALQSAALITRSLKELGRRSSDAEGADVGAALELALGLARREIERKARIEVRLDQLPRVRGDQSRLGQVFLNLLLNAVEALPGGSPDQHVIAVSTRLDGRGRVVVEVSDTGPGIAPEVASRVFQPFASTKSEGSGLGLTICREILSEYGGTIDFESGTGSGTVFRVALPVDQVFASQLLAQA